MIMKRRRILAVAVVVALIGSVMLEPATVMADSETQNSRIVVEDMGHGEYVSVEETSAALQQFSQPKSEKTVLVDNGTDIFYSTVEQRDFNGNRTDCFQKIDDTRYLQMTEIVLEGNLKNDLNKAKAAYEMSPELEADLNKMIAEKTSGEIGKIEIYLPVKAGAKTTNYYFGYKDQRYRDELLKTSPTSGWKTVKKGTALKVAMITEIVKYGLGWTTVDKVISTAESLVTLFDLAFSTFSVNSENLWQAKLNMNKTTKYTAIQWASSTYEVKAVTEKGDCQFFHELTIPAKNINGKRANGKIKTYKAAKYDSADQEAYARRTAGSNPYREVVTRVRLNETPFS